MVELIKLKTTSQFIYKVVSAFLIAIFVFYSIKMFQAQSAQLMLILVIFQDYGQELLGFNRTWNN